MTKLVIVESPTKTKKIQQYLPDGFVVDSCVGHIRDLPASKAEIPAAIRDQPWADYGVDVENGFHPHYVTIRGKGKVIEALRSKLKKADELWIATDEDREGEAIGWHLVQALQPQVPVRRMVFNEITKKAIQDALARPRELDMHLVQAQETRRILDRLYGYTLSPLLWKKIGGNLSAGRVQSVAVRLVVERERERRAFVKGTYWDLTATLHHDEGDYQARLTALRGVRIATGKDFDKDTGDIAEGREVHLVTEDEARGLQARIHDADWTVTGVEAVERRSRPKPPFITSTLQQEANNRLNLSARQAMQAAQRLYENGYITYMRTDSTTLSEEGLAGARAAVEAEFGASFYAGPRSYESKKAKGAQEAHEAIRPAGAAFQHPERTPLSGKDRELYRLIWARTLASQMADERYTQTTATLQAQEATFTATGKHVEFPGYRRAWPAARDEEDTSLPPLKEGEHPRCLGVEAHGHETKPPARYTEATLVAALEAEGVGRPSTYASILDTIQQRGYVMSRGKALVPTFTAFAVTGLLERHFPRLVDTRFTAKMEEALDEIAAGQAEWQPFLRDFYLGPDGLQEEVEQRTSSIPAEEARTVPLPGLPPGVQLKVGRFGPYVEAQRDGKSVTASLPADITPEELDAPLIERLIAARAEGPTPLGTDPASGESVYVLEGRYGPYYQRGSGSKPKRASLPKGRRVEDADLEEALFLLSLPREIGPHPDGGTVHAGLGRYGPYVRHEDPATSTTEYRSLPSTEDLHSVTLEEALALLRQPKTRRGLKVLRDLGPHPDDKKPVHIMEGRYGPYVKHGRTNASLPKGADPDALTLDEAARLLAARRKRGR